MSYAVGEVRMDADWARRLLPLMAAGHTNREMGEKLGLTEGTVKHYNNLLYQWLSARNRAHAVMIGITKGYVSADIAIGITDAAVNAIASAICRRAEPLGPYTLTPNMTWTEAELYLAEAVPLLRLVPL